MANSVGQIQVTVRTNTKLFAKELRSEARKEGATAGNLYGNAFCKNASERIKRCIDKTMKDSNRNTDKAGQSSGKSYGNGFAKGASGILTRRMKAILGAIIAFAQPLVMAAQGAAGGFLALAGSLAQAASAGAALLPLLVGAAGSMAAIKIGSQGVGDSFKAISKEWKEAAEEGRAFNMQSEDIQKSLKNLTPAARGTAEAFGRMQKPLDDMRRSVQEALFKDMEQTLDRLAKNVLPGVSSGLTALAGSVNATARGFATMLEGADLGGIFEGLAPAMKNIGDAFIAFSAGFLTFIKAATPAATTLSQMIENSAKSFEKMMGESAKSGGINAFLTTAISQFQSWWNLLKAVGDTLGTILGAGAATGQGMVDSLTGIINKWNEFLESTKGQDALASFFSTATAVIAAFGPVLKGLSEGIANIVTPNALAMFQQLGVSIGGILPVIGQLLGVIAQTGALEAFFAMFNLLGQAIQPLMPILQELASIISANLATVLPILGEAFRAIVAAVQPLMAALLPLVSALLPALISAFQPVIATVVQVAQAIAATLTPIIGTLAPVIVGAFIAFNPFLRVLMVLGPVLAFIGPAIGKLVAWFINLIAPLAPIIAKIGELIFSFMAFNKVFGLIGRLFAPVIGWFKKGGEAASGLGQKFSGVFTAVGEVLRGFLLVLKTVGEFLMTVFVGYFRIVGAVIRGAITVWAAIFRTVFGVIVKVVESAIGIITGVWARIGGYVQVAFDIVKAIVQGAISFVVGYFNLVKTTWIEIWAAVRAVVTTVWSFITTTIQVAIAVIRFYIMSVAAVFRAVWQGLSAIASGVWTAITTVVRGAMTAIGSVVSTYLNIVIGYFNLVKGVVLAVWNGVRTAATTAMSGIMNAVNTAKAAIIAAFNAAKASVIAAWNGVKAAVSLVIDAIKGLVRALPGSIKNLLSGIGAIFSNIFQGAYNKVKGWIDKIKNIVGGIGSWIKGKIPGLARGGIVMGPQTRIVGEEGPEAVIPLARPLSQIDPSVRKMAAMLRGNAPVAGVPASGGGNAAGLVQNISVVTATANPAAVASEVMNKTLAMAVA